MILLAGIYYPEGYILWRGLGDEKLFRLGPIKVLLLALAHSDRLLNSFLRFSTGDKTAFVV